MDNFLRGFFSVMNLEDLGIILGSMCFLILSIGFVVVSIFVIHKIIEKF